MTTQIHRLRSVKHLLDQHQELQKQEIYFAKPDELNDPMEGFRDIVWKGDEIVWTNLFRHYISCLNLTVVLAKLKGDDVAIDPEEIPIEGLVDDDFIPITTTILDQLCTNVFDRCNLENLILDLANTEHTVRRDELLLYLTHIHYVTLEEIQNIHASYGMGPEAERSSVLRNPPQFTANIPLVIQRLHDEHPDVARPALAALFSVSNLLFENMNLMQKFVSHKETSEVETPARMNRDFIFLDFPKIYLSQLGRILHPEWYLACFLEECRDSSLWAHYGDNHKGACLIFDADDPSAELQLELKCIVGSSERKDEDSGETIEQPRWDYRTMTCHRVRYQKEHEELDFFRSIGVLPTGRLLSTWYTDQAGNRSTCSDHIGSGDEDSWSEAYWRDFQRDITIKTDHWEYEKEVRMILSNSFIDLSEKSSRKLSYRFGSLRGIIFGINMCDKKKMEIIDIVLQKCREEKRESFEFYQAYFDHERNSIEKCKLNIKIPND